MRIERLCFLAGPICPFCKVGSVVGNHNPRSQGHVHASESTTVILSSYIICPGNTLLHPCSLQLWLHPWRDTWLGTGKKRSYFTVTSPAICLYFLHSNDRLEDKTTHRQTALNHDTVGTNRVQEQKAERFSTVPNCSLCRSDLLASDLPLYTPHSTTWGMEWPWHPSLLIIKEAKSFRLGNSRHVYLPYLSQSVLHNIVRFVPCSPGRSRLKACSNVHLSAHSDLLSLMRLSRELGEGQTDPLPPPLPMHNYSKPWNQIDEPAAFSVEKDIKMHWGDMKHGTLFPKATASTR